MAVTSYHSVNRQLLAERVSGSRIDYLSDALGSVTGTTTSSGIVQNRYRYKPFGSRLSKSGVGSDPRFQWLGCRGYRSSQNQNPVYVRMRHYQVNTGAWTTTDPSWRDEYTFLTEARIEERLEGTQSYVYALSNPTTFSDPDGLQSILPLPPLGEPWPSWLHPPDPFPYFEGIPSLPGLECIPPSWRKPPVHGIGSCYNGENRNCCTACGICFSYDQECSGGVAALKGSGFKCGDILLCCTHKVCVEVTVTDTGRGKKGENRIVDFGCCYAKKKGIMDSPGLVPLTCRKMGEKKLKKRVCQNHPDCPGKKGWLCD